jgi:hypothetical protein
MEKKENIGVIKVIPDGAILLFTPERQLPSI